MAIKLNLSLSQRLLLGLIAILSLSYLTLGCSGSHSKKTDWAEEGLKGKVKAYEEEAYLINEDSPTLEKGERAFGAYNLNLIFNKKGFIEKKMRFKTDGSSSDLRVYYYDSKGHKIKVKKESHSKSFGNYFGQWLYQYDKKGNNIEETYYEPTNRLRSKILSWYDNKGNKIETKSYDANDSINSHWLYEFDNKGQIVKATWYKGEKELFSRWDYVFNDKGLEVERHLELFDSKGAPYKRVHYEYDDHNNKTEEFFYNEADSLILRLSHQYQYDSIGNWVQSIQSENEVPKYLIERKYEYFE